MEYYCFNVGQSLSYSPICEDGRCPSLKKGGLDHQRKFLQWGWFLIDAKKSFLNRNVDVGKQDLVMGCCKIGWRQLFWKLRAELKKMIASRPTQGFKYDALSYALNFDDGCCKDSDLHSSTCCGCAAKADPLEPSKPSS
ncbi:hypothetical protein SUGI_0711230 [Cryptomeria japonica]|nr:hypothetical protein SUGI_0711230 [Cryptomeria japonica]